MAIQLREGRLSHAAAETIRECGDRVAGLALHAGCMTKGHRLRPSANITLPKGTGPFPGVVIGAEAYGINPFIHGIRDKLVALGYAVAVPDYYRGQGPSRPEAYDDFSEVVQHIARLDFTEAARDLAAAVDALRQCAEVDATRVSVWGYCTGGTLAWLAACLRGDVAAAILFYPSQYMFRELGPKTPVHPKELLWQLTCPTLFIYGDSDPAMPADKITDLQQRIDGWHVNAEVRLYPNAGHAFCAPSGPMRQEAASRAAWSDAVAFLESHNRN